jgi:ribosome-associated toxin RatA of RatAB toxin-antitoxin module
MYALVNDVAAYPRILPWCRRATVHTADEDYLEATLELAQGGFSGAFRTRNHLQPGRVIDVRLVDGPFRVLEGRWQFDPIDEGASRVAVSMRYQFANPLTGLFFGRIIDDALNSLVDAFTRRARAVHVFG